MSPRVFLAACAACAAAAAAAAAPGPQPAWPDDPLRATRFVQWIHELGGTFIHADLRRTPEAGVGVFAAEDLGRAHVFARVPLSAMLSVEHALTTELVGEIADPLPDADAMAALLAFERRRDDSPWRPWIDVLPDAEDYTFWSDDELMWLDASPWLHEQRQWQERANLSVSEVMDDIKFAIKELEGQITEPDLRWAQSVLRTRLHTLELRTPAGKWVEMGCLVPLADFLNFAAAGDANAACATNPESTHLECFTTRRVAAGDELRAPYKSAASAGELLVKYGFAPADAEPALQLTPSRSFLEMRGEKDRVAMAREAGMSAKSFDDWFPLTVTRAELDSREFTSANALLLLFRLYYLSAEEITAARTLKMAEHTMVDQLAGLAAVSVNNELRAVDELLRMLRGVQEMYSTTLAEDEESVRPFVRDSGARVSGAVAVRMGEKQLLEQFVANVEAYKGELESLGGGSSSGGGSSGVSSGGEAEAMAEADEDEL